MLAEAEIRCRCAEERDQDGLLRIKNAVRNNSAQLWMLTYQICSSTDGAKTREGVMCTQGHGTNRRDRKSTRLNSSHLKLSRMPSSA